MKVVNIHVTNVNIRQRDRPSLTLTNNPNMKVLNVDVTNVNIRQQHKDFLRLTNNLNMKVLNMGDLILIEANLIEFCISIEIHLILIEMMKMHFDSIQLYFNRSTQNLSFRLLYSGNKSKLRNSIK